MRTACSTPTPTRTLTTTTSLFAAEQALSQKGAPPGGAEFGLHATRVVGRVFHPLEEGKAHGLALGEVTLERVVEHAGEAMSDMQIAQGKLRKRLADGE